MFPVRKRAFPHRETTVTFKGNDRFHTGKRQFPKQEMHGNSKLFIYNQIVISRLCLLETRREIRVYLQIHYILFEPIFISGSFIAHSAPVIIDRCQRITQKMSNLVTIHYS